MSTGIRLPRGTDWGSVLAQEIRKPYWGKLHDFVKNAREQGPVYPPPNEVFRALVLCSHADTKVVIVGQDPYPTARQAHGLCFSVPRGVRIPPTLRNIHLELEEDVGVTPPTHGNLEAWALWVCSFSIGY